MQVIDYDRCGRQAYWLAQIQKSDWGAGAFLRELYGLYTALPATPFYEEYRARDLVCGRDVTVLSPDGSTPAHAEEILPDFSLAVRLPDGTRRALAAGEVSLRGWA